MPILHTVSNINKKLLSITRISDPNYFIIHVVIGNDIYECKFDNRPDCCEEFATYTYLGDDIDTEDKTENDIVDYSSITNETITSIRICVYKSSIYIKFIDGTDDALFIIEFRNEHNGYYPHDVIINLYENEDDNGMQIFKTCV